MKDEYMRNPNIYTKIHHLDPQQLPCEFSELKSIFIIVPKVPLNTSFMKFHIMQVTSQDNWVVSACNQYI